MKFKSIEISGFRAYDKPEDATFQFMDAEGEPLNFISIYAPNGFGKTSFYDAIEWGVTNNVSRLWQREKSSEKALDRLRSARESKDKIDLLRNTSATGPTYVQYLASGMKKPVKRTLKIHGSSKADTKRSDGVKLGFRQVILSQEWISAFLKEDDGEIRYKKFMRNPELQATDMYYQNVKALEETNRKKMDDLNTEIYQLKSKIQSLDDENILGGVNELVKKINKDFQAPELQEVTLATTQKEVKDLQDLVANGLIEFDDRSELRVLLGLLDQAMVGGNGIPSLKQYFAAHETMQKIQAETSSIKDYIESFEKMQSFRNELDNSEKQRESLYSSGEALKKLIAEFDKFKEIRAELSEKENLRNNLKKQVRDLEKGIEQIKRELLDSKFTLDGLVKEDIELQKERQSLPQLEKDIQLLVLDISKMEKVIKELSDSISKNEVQRDSVDDGIKELELVRQEALNGQFESTIVSEDKELSDVVGELMGNSDKMHQLKKQLERVLIAIGDQEKLNASLEAFVATGLEIINKNQTDTCPLCEQQYSSYANLFDKVSKNTALSNSIKIILGQRSELNNKLNELDRASEKLLERLIAYYDKQMEKLRSQKSKIVQQLNDENKDLDKARRDLKKLQQTHSKLLVITKGDTLLDYRKDLTKRSNKNSKDLANTLKELSTKEKNLKHKDKSLNEANGRIKLLGLEMDALSSDENYAKLGKWFTENAPGRQITKDAMEQMASINQDSFEKISEFIDSLKERIKAHEEKLRTLDKSQLEERLKKLLDQGKELEKQTGAFEYHLEDRLSIDTEEIDASKLSGELEGKRLEAKQKQEQTQKLLEDLWRLEKLAANLIPFLQSENARITMAECEKELAFLKKTVSPILRIEIKKTKEFLESKVKEFFYVELINEIYRKIDPHPVFKSVEFKADFDLDNPSLDVFVKNNEDERILIPNLYFSTAQINILSLSIFLASALNSKEYDCIFIDDPIQSMDSINILSTIDLLRSIVVNHNKQIILSTHDHNFHNLLKKKLPSKMFRSKFLELESFGKVKDDKVVNA